METIRNYLETMFQSFPNTPNVLKAKDELYAMMEDKLNALMEEGLSEADAVARVIAECGSIEDLAGELGIEQEFARTRAQQHEQQRNIITEPAVLEYLTDMRRFALLLALGVGCLIASFVWPIALSDTRFELIGLIGMFLMWAIGVGILIINGTGSTKWSYLKHTPCQLDFPTLKMVNEMFAFEQRKLAVLLAVGIGFCILAVLPPIIFDFFGASDNLGAVFLFLLVAVGVGFIISASNRRGAYMTLLMMNDRETVGGNQFTAQKNMNVYADPGADFVMSVYWQTVTCIYLSWSFLTFHWWVTWIIWPVAAVLRIILNAVFGGGERR